MTILIDTRNSVCLKKEVTVYFVVIPLWWLLTRLLVCVAGKEM